MNRYQILPIICILPLISAGVIFCRNDKKQPPVPAYNCIGGDMDTKFPPVPDGVFLQVLLIDDHGHEAGYRFYHDGRYESKMHSHSENPWIFSDPLTPEKMVVVYSIVNGVDFDSLHKVYQPEETIPDMAQNVLFYQKRTKDGTESFIKVVRPCEVPVLKKMQNQLVDIFRNPEVNDGE